MFPRTDIDGGWGAQGTSGGPLASFFKRYHRPLVRYACYRFGVPEQTAEELTSSFLTRELEREAQARSLYQLFEPERGRFRSLLSASFWRFCRDELVKQNRHTVEPLERPDLIACDAAALELSRLIARELFNGLRATIAAGLEPDELPVLALKWPTDPDEAPATNADAARELGLTRGRVRHVVKRIADRFTFGLRQQVQDAGLEVDEARAFLGSCCELLDRETREPPA